MNFVRYLILAAILFFFKIGSSKDFPVSNYQYAKVFIFNSNWKQTSERPDYHIFNNYYSNTKRGDGYTLKENDLAQLLETVNNLSQEMHQGLSKCFIPRHGLIFYNEKHQPVASMSICFECERLTTWDSDSSYSSKVEDYISFTPKRINKTAKGFDYLKHVFKNSGIPVFENESDYTLLFPKDTSAKILAMEHLIILNKSLTSLDIKNWLSNVKEVIEKSEKKFTSGGDRYEFKRINYKNSSFLFFDNSEDSKLAEATIKDYDILTSFGLQLGQSFKEINASTEFTIPEETPKLKIISDKIQLTLYFDNETLIQIDINQF